MNAVSAAKEALADAQSPRPVTDFWQGKFPAPRKFSRDQSPRSLGNSSTETPDVHREINETMSGVLRKRNDYEEHTTVGDYWELSQLSAPPAYANFQSWRKSGTPARKQDPKNPNKWFNTYWYPKGTGPTQYIYNMESELDLSHSVSLPHRSPCSVLSNGTDLTFCAGVPRVRRTFDQVALHVAVRWRRENTRACLRFRYHAWDRGLIQDSWKPPRGWQRGHHGLASQPGTWIYLHKQIRQSKNEVFRDSNWA